MKRSAAASGSGSKLLSPPWKEGRPVGLVMIPGGLVDWKKYEEPMLRWQAEAKEVGISLWIGIQSYWGNLPLPLRTVANVKNQVKQLRADGLPGDAPVFYTGHSMGAGANMPPIDQLYREGVIKGAIIQAAYVLHEYMPPMAASWNWPTPTLTVGGDMNFGSSRITRMAEAVYNQPDTYPVVVIEGMNHMQFASGFEKEDLKPYISEAEGQQQVAKVSVDWIAKDLGFGSGALVQAEAQRTKALVAPIIAAYEYEGSRMFNVPNQPGTSNSNCPGGVCAQGSMFISEAQAYVATGKAAKSATIQSKFADLKKDISAATKRPFISGKVLQAFAMVAGDVAFFEKDFNEPHHPGEILAKFVSRQVATKTLLGKSAPADADLCKELNQMAYDYALKNAGAAAQRRFNASGQALVFDDTVYHSRAKTWTSKELSWKEKGSEMHVQSQGLLTDENSKEGGTHFCKLLSPARAMEWVYVDGLKAKLFGVW